MRAHLSLMCKVSGFHGGFPNCFSETFPSLVISRLHTLSGLWFLSMIHICDLKMVPTEAESPSPGDLGMQILEPHPNSLGNLCFNRPQK